jgi:hypothetical protein
MSSQLRAAAKQATRGSPSRGASKRPPLVKLSEASDAWKLKTWAMANQIYAPMQIPGKQPSHLLIDGGALYASLEQMPQMHQVLAYDIGNNTPLPISEIATLFHRMFIDIDGEALEVPREPHYFRLGQLAVQTAHRFIRRTSPEQPTSELGTSCIVLATEPRELPTDPTKPKRYKFGVHLVFPDVHVGHAEQIHYAEDFACSVQRSAERVLPTLPAKAPAHGTVDMQVFQSEIATKIRMPRTWKAERCIMCDGSRSMRDAEEERLPALKRAEREKCLEKIRQLEFAIQECKGCSGRGRINLAYTYKVKCVIASDGTLDVAATKHLRDEANIFDMLQQCCIRTNSTSPRPDFFIHADCPAPSKFRFDSTSDRWIWSDKTSKRLVGDSADDADLRDGSSRKKGSGGSLAVAHLLDADNPGVQAWLEQFRNESEDWQDLHVSGKVAVFCESDTGRPAYAKMEFSGSGKHNCHNITNGGRHKTGVIHSIATPRGVVYQRCDSKKDTKTVETGDRVHCICKEMKFAQEIKLQDPLPPEVLTEIFGDMALLESREARSRYKDMGTTGDEFLRGEAEADEERNEVRMELAYADAAEAVEKARKREKKQKKKEKKERKRRERAEAAAVAGDAPSEQGEEAVSHDPELGEDAAPHSDASPVKLQKKRKKRKQICPGSEDDDEEAGVAAEPLPLEPEEEEEPTIQRSKRRKRMLLSDSEEDAPRADALADGDDVAMTIDDAYAVAPDLGDDVAAADASMYPVAEGESFEEMMFGEEYRAKIRKNDEIRKRHREKRRLEREADLQKKMKRRKKKLGDDAPTGADMPPLESMVDAEEDEIDIGTMHHEYREIDSEMEAEEGEGRRPASAAPVASVASSRAASRVAPLGDAESDDDGDDSDSSDGEEEGGMKRIDAGPVEVMLDHMAYEGPKTRVIKYIPLKTNQVTDRHNRAVNERLRWELNRMRHARVSRYDSSVKARMKNTLIPPCLNDGTMPLTKADSSVIFRDINTQTGRNMMLHDFNVWIDKHDELFREIDYTMGYAKRPAPIGVTAETPEQTQARVELEETMKTSRIVYRESDSMATGSFSEKILNGGKLKSGAPTGRRPGKAPAPPDAFESTAHFQAFVRERERQERLRVIRADMRNLGGRKADLAKLAEIAEAKTQSMFSHYMNEQLERILCANASRHIVDALQLDADYYKRMDAEEPYEEQYKGDLADRKAIKRFAGARAARREESRV